MIVGPAPERRDSRARITARIVDAGSGEPVAARVRVLCSDGTTTQPSDALTKMGTGRSQFYADGSFSIDVPSGPTEVLVERGTEYLPWRRTLSLREDGRENLDITLERWFDRRDLGWVSGNPHVHYDTETRLTERIRLDPRVEDLDVMATSHVERGATHYTGNDLPIGVHPESTPEHIIDTGEECRHNRDTFTAGFGHVMLIGITTPILPISRGILVADDAPDYPPLIGVCEEARRQGGLIYWCHGAIGFEAPIAALRGLADGVGLLDPWWLEPEFDTWYRLLNCGFRLAALTGGDWYICSSHRTYVAADHRDGYSGWLDGVCAGRTMATSGPIVELTVDAQQPSSRVLGLDDGRRVVPVEVRWRWTDPLDIIEIVADGEVARTIVPEPGQLEGSLTFDLPALGVGWVAARCSSHQRSAWDHATWAHTSPVYLRETFDEQQAAREETAALLDAAIEWLETEGRFDDRDQLAELVGIYNEAQVRLRAGDLPG